MDRSKKSMPLQFKQLKLEISKLRSKIVTYSLGSIVLNSQKFK